MNMASIPTPTMDKAGTAIARLRGIDTGKIVGWLYLWDGDEFDIFWKDGARAGVFVDRASFCGENYDVAKRFVEEYICK